jgi:hypothetical protein
MMNRLLPFIGYLLLTVPGMAQQDCRSFDYRQAQLKNNPALAVAVAAAEQFTRRQLQIPSVAVTGAGQNPKGASLPLITIPVVVHIIYNTSAENISDAQVQTQIDVLNADYQKLNADTARIPGYFTPLAASCGFRFVLAGLDTNGVATTGIIRRHTTIQGFSINDDIKFSARGGDDAWDRDHYLNIWVGNLTGGVLGYSSLVGGPKATDGVVVLYTAFGTNGTAIAPFNLGRTATHETGHWLNMIHTWGDDSCGTDEVGDTPPQQAATRGNPSGMIISCGNGPYGNMYMNYMDFTDDIGMHMFTYGQRDRMRTLFAAGGFRYPLLSSPAASVAPVSTGTSTTVVSGNEISVQIYPNPAATTVLVRMNNQAMLGSLLDVYNQMGQKVLSRRMNDLSLQLDLSAWPGGVYFLHIADGHQQNTFKLVKM